MSRSIGSYPEWQQQAVVRRRVQEQQGGLGYLAALDAQRRLAFVADRERRAQERVERVETEQAA